jgi:Na+/pantothenate symporter
MTMKMHKTTLYKTEYLTSYIIRSMYSQIPTESLTEHMPVQKITSVITVVSKVALFLYTKRPTIMLHYSSQGLLGRDAR